MLNQSARRAAPSQTRAPASVRVFPYVITGRAWNSASHRINFLLELVQVIQHTPVV
jgi:hypothetical protein